MMMKPLRAMCLVAAGLWIGGSGVMAGQQPPTPGETFTAKAKAENAEGAAVSAPIVIHLDRYTPDFDRKRVEEGLRAGGYPGFVTALKGAPNVGYVQLNGRKIIIRYARQVATGSGRTIVFVTDKPVAFLGGAADTSKSRAGYLIAAIELNVDAKGSGTGRMAAAARVKAGGETGVQIDNYAEDAPIILSAVVRK